MLRCLLLVISGILIYGQLSAKGVAFLDDYALAQKRSAAEGKPIFLDAYTTWCAPCKRMEAEVFSQDAIKQLLENEFIPLRLDMEREPGATLAKTYNINQYPTLLILDAKGEVHRGVGYFNVEELSAFAKTGLDSKNNFRAMQARFAAGDRDKAFLQELLAYAKTAGIPEQDTYVYAYLLSTDGWNTALGQEQLYSAVSSAKGPLFDSLVAQRESLGERFGQASVDERIARLLDDSLFGKEPVKKKEAKRLIERAYPAVADSTYLRYQMRVAREAGKAKRFGKLAIKSQDRYPSDDADELEELIYVFESRLTGWKTDVVAGWKVRQEALREEEGSW